MNVAKCLFPRMLQLISLKFGLDFLQARIVIYTARDCLNYLCFCLVVIFFGVYFSVFACVFIVLYVTCS